MKLKLFNKHEFTKNPKHQALSRMGEHALRAGATVPIITPTTINTVTPPEPVDQETQGTPTDLTGRPFMTPPPSIHDVHQGMRADCYYLAVIAGIIFQRPDLVPFMTKKLSEQVYQTRFYLWTGAASFNAEDVNVSPLVQSSDTQPGPDGDIYVPMMEKAYIWMRGTRYQPSSNKWTTLDYGSAKTALTDLGWLTRQDILGSSLTANTLQTIADLLAARCVVAGQTNASITGAPLIPSHVCAITSVDVAQQTITLYNPWGVDGAGTDSDPNDGTVQITLAQARANLYSISIADGPQWSTGLPVPLPTPLPPVTPVSPPIPDPVTPPVTPLSPAPTAILTASPTVVKKRGSVSLSWVTKDATSVTLDGAPVGLNGGKSIPSLTTSHTFVLAAVGPGGNAFSRVTVTVTKH